jgi:phosphopantothenoylcysteine decarboxylase/phosphopantothenate--cysteine ligase
MLTDKRILMIIGGGIAAYKSLELIRRLQDQGASVRAILTEGGSKFITPLSVASLTGDKCYMDLFSLTDEAEMGHIRLSREADLVLVSPATADLMASMAHGHARDLATTALLATNKPVMICPSMNVEMWQHPATQRNVAILASDGITQVGPEAGDLACGEVGSGRLSEVPDIVDAVTSFFLNPAVDAGSAKSLVGRHALVTAGPTWEAIDPVRYIANHSSGRQGYAIAGALARLGARTTLVSGPTNLPAPAGVEMVNILSARDMQTACQESLPADIAVCVAAVGDWHVANETTSKVKKNGGAPPALDLVENPDILAGLCKPGNLRPDLVVGFAAETDNVVDYATAKRERKGCDWIVANDVSPATGIMGGANNTVHLISDGPVEDWPEGTKEDIGLQLAQRIARHFEAETKP